MVSLEFTMYVFNYSQSLLNGVRPDSNILPISSSDSLCYFCLIFNSYIFCKPHIFFFIFALDQRVTNYDSQISHMFL